MFRRTTLNFRLLGVWNLQESTEWMCTVGSRHISPTKSYPSADKMRFSYGPFVCDESYGARSGTWGCQIANWLNIYVWIGIGIM
jgi:hypothetical protein